MKKKRKGTSRNTRLYMLLVGLVIVAAAAMIALNVRDPVPQIFLDLTKTQQALYQTATYFGQFPSPQPSMTYYPSECAYGITSACNANQIIDFEHTLERFELYGATWAAETLTAEAQITATP